ncbi:PAS domain S-box protein [Lacibacter sediminis]|uniref:histidine kinase n=1 Tax=Lacibacter sediminis TaxID=2760713 RepID=A0A7G5XG91_9BACT|nr:PAS domain S-box protein [Lacibacter sediminis]QNA44494.1 PAS domain S-box protein [Lacibacter sediminis]
MKLSIRSSILVTLLLFTILIVSIVYITIRRTATLKDTNQEVMYSEDIRYQLQQLLLAVLDNETGARGYVITSNESFLEPLYASERTLKSYSSQLEHRIQNPAIKSIFIDSLKPLLSKRIVFSRLMIKTTMLHNSDAARDLVASGVGKRYTDSIRLLGIKINALQNTFLQQKRSNNEQALRQMNVFLFSMLFIIFCLFAVIFRWIVLYFKKQKQTEEELEEKVQKKTKEVLEGEVRFRKMIEQISDGFFTLDINWRFTYINANAAQLFDQSVIGKNIWECFPETSGGEIHTAFQQAMNTQKEVFYEGYSSYFKRWIEISIYPASDGLVIYFRDITEKRLAEIEAQRSREQYKTLIERISDAFIAVDHEFRYTFLNKQAEELIHKPADELIGKTVWEIFPDAVGSDTFRAFEKAMKEQVYVTNTDHYPALDLWQENHIYPSSDGLSVFIRNITKLKKNEIAARNSEEIRRIIMNSSLDAIICVDNSNNIIFWNNQAESLFGWSFDEIKAKPFHETIIPTGYRKFAEKGILHFLHSRNAESLDRIIETTVVNRDGKEFPVEFFALKVLTDNNSFTCAYIRDISKRKELQQQLIRQQKKTASEITATAIDAQEKERNAIGQELHDNINQLLAGTKLLLQMIQKNPEKHTQYLTMCVDAINQVMNENRRIAHEMVTPFLSQETLVDLIYKIANSMLAFVGIDVEVELNNFNEDGLNEKQKLTLYRIAQEQCTNIIKYANASKVIFSLASNEESIRLTIRDDGDGMTTKAAKEGIGLKNIASRLSVYNGTMDIITSPGNGFMLSVELQTEDMYQGV